MMLLDLRSAALCFLALMAGQAFAQNLLPDGGFEKVVNNNCLSPIGGFKKMQYWYLLDATPDLFERGCPFNEEDFVYWDETVEPYEGNNYAGIWSRWNSNNTFFSEGIATTFTRPLEVGKTYFFEMAILNQGTYQGLGGLIGCTLEPDKHIDLYLSADSIRIENDFANGTATTNARLAATLRSNEIQSDGSEDWTLVSSCFKAQGGERFFAIILPLGTFGPLPSCAETQATSGVFRSFYYHIDAVSITELPLIQEVEIATCRGKEVEVDLPVLFDLSLLKGATFTWSDGTVGPYRRLSEGGEYHIEAEVACTRIPLLVTVTLEDCPDNFFVPNAFSPNSDGQNDLFQVGLKTGENLPNFQMIIYDRWGNAVFRSSDPSVPWDGKSRGREVAEGLYIWLISYEVQQLEKVRKVLKHGDLVLIR